MTHDYKKALEIAMATEQKVKELDFGNVFWACGVLAAEAERVKKERDELARKLSSIDTTASKE